MILIGRYVSPFVRRVAVTLRSYGLAYEHQPLSVWDDAERIGQLNPLRRVPTLLLPDGTALVETFAILDALDDQVGEARAWLPRSGAKRRDGLRLTALASGMADKAVALLYEGLVRDQRSPNWVRRCEKQIVSSLDVLEAELSARGTPFFLGDALSHPDVALACSFRFASEVCPTLFVDARWPTLRALCDRCEALPAFTETFQAIPNNLNRPGLNAVAELELFLVDKNDTSWSLRPWLLLAHHGIPFMETSFIAADPQTPSQIAHISPTGKVPVLRVGKELVWESLAIIETLAELYPACGIWPHSAAARRHARSLAAEMHAGFGELRRYCPMNLALRIKVELDPARQRELARFEQLLRSARRFANDGGPFLFGEFCAADAMLAPVATRIRSYGLTVSAETQQWLDAVFALPAFQRWEREAEVERRVRPPAAAIGVPLKGRLQERIPDGPSYAAIFANQLAEPSAAAAGADYESIGRRMLELAQGMPGYLDHYTARDAQGFGITVSYWSSLDAIATWRAQAEHAQAQELGRSQFYAMYDLRIARVERRAGFRRAE